MKKTTSKTSSNKGIGRRKFIKGAAAAGASRPDLVLLPDSQ